MEKYEGIDAIFGVKVDINESQQLDVLLEQATFELRNGCPEVNYKIYQNIMS